MSRPDRGSRGPIALALALVALSLATPPSPPVGAAAQKGFETPEAATTALVDAVRSGNRNALLEILGPGAAPLVYSGDQVADRNAGERFVADYDRGHHLEGGGGKVVLYVGDDDFPFPIPLVPDGTEWRFDTKAGKDEILNRRIGRNELSAIEVVLAYVDAQREYYSKDRNADGLREYAQRFASTPGQHDGLSWDAKPGEDPSPLGPLVARARAEGYPGARRAGGGVPYHGYYYRILTSQGPGALGGAYDYIAHGRMIGGFALVAFPAQYGVSGVMTFIVNHDGVVYQKDLGPDTDAIARAMKQFNPDSSWKQI
ncbi:MAG TPA: DUF2950 domain-containing protein [Candidatus Methylomirabilis sp.]|nr:DUF2950 domain-containing protein [Candidatus Methylomirabilis sp.]